VSGLVSGAGMGAAASIAGFMVSSGFINTITKSGQSGIKSISDSLQGRSYKPNFNSPYQTPTTSSGKFKDVMTDPVPQNNNNVSRGKTNE
jgi:hypothetical protein